MIRSRSNDHLKSIRRLRRSKDDEWTVLEGPHLLQEALAAGLHIERVLVTPEYRSSPELAPLLDRLGSRALLVEPALLAELADADAPQGVVAVVQLPRSAIAPPGPPRASRLLYLDGIQDPGNLGALARVAEASGEVDLLVLAPGTAHPNHPRALRASAGSLLRMPVAIRATPEAVDAAFAPARPAWIGLAPRGGELLWDTTGPPDEVWILALGAEGPGLSPAVEARIDRRWTIPVNPPVESLNVAVAAAVVLYELRRRRADTP
jgi:TrmH family RNA methyltransferase